MIQQRHEQRQTSAYGGWILIALVLAVAAGFVWWVDQAQPAFERVEQQLSLKR